MTILHLVALTGIAVFGLIAGYLAHRLADRGAVKASDEIHDDPFRASIDRFGGLRNGDHLH